MNPEQIEPGQARGTFREKYWQDQQWVVQEKLDGARYIMHVHDDHTHLTSRTISVVDGKYVEKTNNFPQLFNIPKEFKGCVFDGEIIWPYGDVTQLTGALPEYAINLQEQHGYAQYYVFDILYNCGTDVRDKKFIDRMDVLDGLFKIINNKHIFMVPYTQTCEDKKPIFDSIIARGGEGVILKHVCGEYGNRRMWVKVKNEKRYDVFITGYLDALQESTKVSGEVSVTRYHEKGWIGALKIGQYVNGKIRDVGRVSGFNEELRATISENKDQFLGKVIEIKAQQRLKSGMFRHPRFVRLRDDKRQEDCIYWKDEA